MGDRRAATGEYLGIATDVYEDETGGFYILVPSLPGCASQGETVEECFRNIEDAIELYLAIQAEDAALHTEGGGDG